MVRKKLDERMRTLLSNCVKTNHRSLWVIVGDNGKDQVVNIHYLLSKLQIKARPSVLWCYKKELGFSTHKKKRMQQIKKMVQRGLYDPERDDPFELFCASTNIRWTYYKDSEKVLGQTFGMCVLQDFEALTPNLLARTVETVEGGGAIIILLKTLDSLKQFYSITMDIHSRFRTESHDTVKPRFNERFILSLASCKACMVVDDELNVLPISKHTRDIEPLEQDGNEIPSWDLARQQQKELKTLQEGLAGTQPAANLVGLARTVDQAKAILNFIDAVADKSLASTVTLTAGRGRGKSAALGVAIASAVAVGYSNIFVTSPSPENLKTVFEFLFKGLDAIEYKEHLDYEIIQSTNPEFNNCVVRVNIFHEHRQTIQYIDPADSEKLAQAELVVIDEAAAIPLPLVKKLIGPYLVFMSSTIHGYEGTGRSLSLKLIQQLRQSTTASKSAAAQGNWRTNEYMFKGNAKSQKEALGATQEQSQAVTTGKRGLREIELHEPIRYSREDPVEEWLNHTLCLKATDAKQVLAYGTPPPSQCELFAVDRDTLFSHHAVSESILERIVSLFVASHYKNSPNDLQLLSDAPAHRLFVLLGPQKDDEAKLPDILVAIQVSLEGGIAQKSVAAQLSQGSRSAGDLVPWTVSQQFQDHAFARLDGARIVRIATHPGATRMGYGKRAVELLSRFYQGEFVNPDADQNVFENMPVVSSEDIDRNSLLKEKIKPRGKMPPLLVPISDLKPERLHYVSVSFGATEELFSFWNQSGFRPVYLRQTQNDLTGEHTCIMIKPEDCDDLEDAPVSGWLDGYCKDFCRRFLALCGGPFRTLSTTLSLSVVSSAYQDKLLGDLLKPSQVELFFSAHDLKRLDAYSRNLVDFHLVMDLLPRIAGLYLENRLPESLKLSILQRALLLGMGLQMKTVEVLSAEYDVPATQLLALFNKSVRKLSSTLNELEVQQEAMVVDSSKEMKNAREMQQKLKSKNGATPIHKSMDAEQEASGHDAMMSLLDEDLQKYAVKGTDEDWGDIGNVQEGQVVSIKKRKPEDGGYKTPSGKSSDGSKHKGKSSSKDRSFQRSSKKKHKRG